ncbi:hypothetical protein LTR50_002648 [Elasticomyces elasticus]|nr:hypothetical protein LTR50_002648 [Elasticomyces elasticus]
MLRAGKKIHAIVDANDGVSPVGHISEYGGEGQNQGKFFDLISFDPRGVGLSKPSIHCFQNRGMYESFNLRTMAEGILGSSDAVLGRLWSMAHALGSSCAYTAEEDDIKMYVSTASSARDMLEIVEQHGEWREREAIRLYQDGRDELAGRSDVPEELRYKPGEEKIQYWGFSYGTFLGSTFAAMFPDRIGRFVLDGVVDAEDYKQTLWYDNLLDTEKDMRTFYHHCARVGYPTCALASEGDTPDDIENKVRRITERLYHNPLPVIGPNPEVIEYSDVKNLIFAALYTPQASFPYLATLLAEVDKGNGTQFAELLAQYHTYECDNRPPDAALDALVPLRNKSASTPLDTYAMLAIACGDGDSRQFENKTYLQHHIDRLDKMSPTIGKIWAQIRLDCVGWKIRPKFRFTGLWQANTSHPILWIGNTADPVCPLASAHKMAQGFPGSVVLTQDSPGHCSTSAFSRCSIGHIRAHFQTGALPPPGTVCGADELPFGAGPDGTGVAALDAAEVRLMEAHREVGGAVHLAGGGFMRNGMLGGRVRDGWW